MPLDSSKHMGFTRQLFADQILRPTQRFFRKQVASSVLLLAATAIALIWANSNIFETYHSFWHTKISLVLGDLHIS